MAAMLSAKKVPFESDENAKPNQEVWRTAVTFVTLACSFLIPHPPSILSD
jgi:hypothetical protein